MLVLYYSEEVKYKAEEALIAANFNGIALKLLTFKDHPLIDLRGKNPLGQVPLLETSKGCISGHAVTRYIARCRADTELYGRSFMDECEIEDWLEFSLQVEIPLMDWVYRHKCASATKVAQDVKKALTVVEKHLSDSRHFLTGHIITLADIVLVCCLKEGFVHVFEGFRKLFPKLCDWFERCCNVQLFQAVLGPVTCCESLKAPSFEVAKVASSPLDQEKQEAMAKIQAVGQQVRDVKVKLIRRGFSGKQISAHPEIWKLVEHINHLQALLG